MHLLASPADKADARLTIMALKGKALDLDHVQRLERLAKTQLDPVTNIDPWLPPDDLKTLQRLSLAEVIERVNDHLCLTLFHAEGRRQARGG